MLILSFSYSVSAGDYFDITESFNYNVYGNSSNYWAGGINPYWINESIGNSYVWRMDNDWYVFFKQGDKQPIRNITQDGLNTLSSYSYLNSDFRIAYVMNISRCNYDNCFLTPQTRLEFHLSYQAYTITGSNIYPNIAFKSKYLNHSETRLDFNNTNGYFISETYDLDAGDFEGYNFDYGNTSISSPISMTYRPNYVYCNISQFINGGFVNITLGDLPSDNPYCNVNYNDEIDGFWITFKDDDDGVSQEQYIADLKIYNLFNGSNELPYANLSFNNTCFNESLGYDNVNIELDIADTEGDTIYYFENIKTELTENITIKFYDQECLDILWSLIPACTLNKNYDFLDNVYYKSDTCRISQEKYNSSMFNLYYDETDTGKLYGLRLQDQCDKTDKSFYYDLGLPSRNVDVVNEVRNLDDEDNFNLSLLGEDLSEEIKLMFDVNSKINIYQYNSSDEWEFLTNITRQDILYELYNVDITATNINFKIWDSYDFKFPFIDDSSSYQFLTLENTADDPIKYFSINLNSGDILLGGIQHRGSVSSINWTTTKPDSFRIYSAGNYPYDLYITDSVHKDIGEYRLITENVFVSSCRYKADDISSKDYSFPFIWIIDDILGKSFKNYMQETGLYELGKVILWWIFVFMFFGMIISGYFMFRVFDITLPLIVSGFSCFVIAYFLGYTTHILSMLFFIALGLTLIFTRSIKR